MSFSRGDIVKFYSVIAGYPKYHLCVLACLDDQAGIFLFINSDEGFAGDFVLDDDELRCLPESPTGKSVISCSQPVRANGRQLALYNAEKLGELPPGVARRLERFVQNVQTLTRIEKRIVLEALAELK